MWALSECLMDDGKSRDEIRHMRELVIEQSM
jgi:hypothetical protein